MNNKIVFVLGAGFSASANLPIQAGILKEMTKESKTKELMDDDDSTSLKYLEAYIDVGLFLIEQYTKTNIESIKKQKEQISNDYIKIIHNNLFLEKLFKIKKIKVEIQNTCQLKKFIYEQKKLYDYAEYKKIQKLSKLKEEIRLILKDENLKIDLEDLFTLLDKCVREQRHWGKYSFIEIFKLRQSILLLFVYYFGKSNANFKINNCYKKFQDYLKCNSKNVDIITTNWDTICEQILESANLKYDLCCNDYLYFKNKNIKTKTLKLAKVHGSINWMTCLNCGTIMSLSKDEISSFLLEKKQLCHNCKQQMDFDLFTPEIITPTMIKKLEKQLYCNIWQNAEYILSNARKVIFIGYSLPLSDFEFKNMLEKYIPSNIPIDVVLKEDAKPIVECNSYPCYRYNASFPKANIRYYYDGFDNYITSILSNKK